MAWWNSVGSDGSSGSGSTPVISQQPQSGGFDWGNLIDIGANILGSVAPAIIGNQGANKQADAITGANQQAINLQRDNYNDQINRQEPWRKSGFNALNFQNAWLGLPGVSDGGAGGIGGGNGAMLPNLGAGQPVAGHSGGGGPNGLTSAIGAGVGNFFGGPIGGAVGGALGGLIRNGGDNWTTLATGAPAGFDYGAYMQQPDLAAEWSKPDVQSLFGGNQDAYANWHYNKFGKGEGRTLNPITGQGGTGGTPGTGANGQPIDVMGTIQNNPLYKSAVDGFLGVDTPQIRGAYATGGQALSGAQTKALHDRGVARSYGAVGDIWNQYAGMSGTGQTAVQGQNQAGGQFGANAANNMLNIGNAQGNAAATKNANWMGALTNGLSGGYAMGKEKGWF